MDMSLSGSRELKFLLCEMLDLVPQAGAGESRGLEVLWSRLSRLAARAGLGEALDSAVLCYRDYLHALSEARRVVGGATLLQRPDHRRWLLAQKALTEARLGLCVYAASLCEPSDSREADIEVDPRRSKALLSLLMPVIGASWTGTGGPLAGPAESDAMIVDKLPGQDRYAYEVFKQEVQIALQVAELHPAARGLGPGLEDAVAHLDKLVRTVLPSLWKGGPRALVNQAVYLGIIGRIVLAWVLVNQAAKAAKALETSGPVPARAEAAYYRGKLQAARYYLEWELPLIGPPADQLLARNSTCHDMKDSWFGPKC